MLDKILYELGKIITTVRFIILFINRYNSSSFHCCGNFSLFHNIMSKSQVSE